MISIDIRDRLLSNTLVWSAACSGSYEYDNADLPLADPGEIPSYRVSYRELNMVSDSLPSVIPQPRKPAPDLEVLRRVEILAQPALPAVPVLPDVHA
mgnify:FL=1|jgi:hypothetical protein